MTTKHTYPPAYGPGVHWTIDEAWEILDAMPPGTLPEDWRSFIAGKIAGTLMKHSGRCVRCGGELPDIAKDQV